MSLTLQIVLALVFSAAVITILWRLASRRASLPCPSWLGWLVELDNPFAREQRAAAIIQHLDLESGMRVLDAGCGPGRDTIPLAQAVRVGGEVVAADVQSRTLDRLRHKAREAGLTNITFRELALGEKTLEKDRYDRALLVTVLGEIPDREAALREIHDALKPGGILSVTETVFDPHYQSRKTVQQLAGAAGFSKRAFFGNSVCFTMHLQKP
jgi:ubiquinone/menaquinone biosynthesis C-methylase UbiE